MDCEFCDQKGFEGVVCPKCGKDMVSEAHKSYNTIRAKTDPEGTVNWHEIEKYYRNLGVISTSPRKIVLEGFEMIEATVKPHSTSAHVGLPKKWTGCRVAVVRLDEGSESTEPR